VIPAARDAVNRTTGHTRGKDRGVAGHYRDYTPEAITAGCMVAFCRNDGTVQGTIQRRFSNIPFDTYTSA
jgi:hypothetical protein